MTEAITAFSEAQQEFDRHMDLGRAVPVGPAIDRERSLAWLHEAETLGARMSHYRRGEVHKVRNWLEHGVPADECNATVLRHRAEWKAEFGEEV